MYKQRYTDRKGREKERWVETWTGADGRRVYVTAQTRNTLRSKVAEAKGRKPPSAGAAQPLGEYLEGWLARAGQDRRASTLHDYAAKVRLYILPLLGSIPVGELTPADVSRVRDAMAAQGLSSSTIIQARAILRRALADLVEDEVLPRNVAAVSRPPKRRTPEMSTWTREHASAFLTHARGDRLEALWMLLLMRGLRIGEGLGLQKSRVDLEAKTARIDAALHKLKGAGLVLMAPKTEASIRVAMLSHELVDALGRRLAADRLERLAAGSKWQEHGLVFSGRTGKPLWPAYVRVRFHRLCLKAGVPRIRVHDLRHTCATLMLEQGTSPRVAQEVLGHASVQVTLGIYSHVSAKLEHEALAKLDRSILGA